MYEFQNRLFIIVRRKPYSGRYFKDVFVIVVVIIVFVISLIQGHVTGQDFTLRTPLQLPTMQAKLAV